MKFVTISDVHIKEPGDEAEVLFMSFLSSDEVAQSDAIFLLGDIFDLMVGGYLGYRIKFKTVFNKLIGLCMQGKIIYQFEGNHDFHFQKLVEHINEKELGEQAWFYINGPYVMKEQGARILFAHGDELELDNPSYQIYRYFIRSRFIRNLADYFCHFGFVEAVGQHLSRKSRKRNNKNYGQKFNQDLIKERFRKSARLAQERFNCSIYVCGHSHCLDQWSDGGINYYNNGYFPKEKIFFYYDEKVLSPIKL
jgi:UDP-2,3-diacylglucosamine hydrolase